MKSGFGFTKRNPVLHLRQTKFTYFCHFLQETYRKFNKCQIHTFLTLSVYKSFHQPVKYGRQRNHILQDSTGLEISISMKASKTKNRFRTGFQQPKSGLKENRY